MARAETLSAPASFEGPPDALTIDLYPKMLASGDGNAAGARLFSYYRSKALAIGL